jgi:hypothetical protein
VAAISAAIAIALVCSAGAQVVQPAQPTTTAPDARAAEPEPASPDAGPEVIEAGADPPPVPDPEPPVPPGTILAGESRPDTAPWSTKIRWSGYIDVGFFDSQGNGSGHQIDAGHLLFPELDDVTWVFYGDPLSTAVNARGEPADTGDSSNASRAIMFDSVDSRGKPTFLVNEVNLDLTVSPHRRWWLLASTDLVPRGRNISDPAGNALGDFVDIDLAFANWTAISTLDHAVDLQIGKVDSVLGIEYRVQESPDRFGVTPSLLFRYTGGHPIGLKARARLWDELVNVAVAVTNGSHFVELFPFYDEQDTNSFKTVAGRLGVRLDGPVIVEVGGSGLIGAQDQQEDTFEPRQWQIGGDVDIRWGELELRAEYMRGRARGETETMACDVAPCLRFQGAYGEMSFRVTNSLGFLARVDWRDADHRFGTDFAYIVDTLRGTAGARLELDRFVIIKAEYIRNLELQDRPTIRNDVFTSALVLFF